MRRFLVGAAVAAALSAPAGAVVIPGAAKSAAAVSVSGNGLKGKFYDAAVSDATAAHAPGYFGTPDGTFTATRLDYYSDGDGVSVVGFLGDDGASFTGTDPGNFTNSVLTFDGYINITSDLDFDLETAGIQFDMAVGSDDGFDLVIGGVHIGSAGVRAFSTTYMPVSFADEGLYSFSLLYFENGGYNGLTAGRFMGEGTQAFSTQQLFQALPDAEVPADVPEPAMLGLFGLGAFGLGLARRRR